MIGSFFIDFLYCVLSRAMWVAVCRSTFIFLLS